ncbi:MAG: NFACT family protein [Hydrococcus sp. C42_A2020_068]|nr:NFACT family protein [Hydrococcus sp. C42_A2020_068]
MQSVDFTTLTAACAELRTRWLPARVEQVYQRDRYTVVLALRTLKQRGWLTLCWHPQAARICIGDAPPRIPDTFTFSDQLRHQLNGYALTAIDAIAPWERVVDLQFAKRPGDLPQWHLYVEIIGKYSNVILTDANTEIVTAAHQVTASQSSVRTVQTGQPYELPPALAGNLPSLSESRVRWQERVSLIPGAIERQLLKSYRGLSPTVARSMVRAANLEPERSTQTLADSDWQRLFHFWQEWLQILEAGNFKPGWTEDGYTVLGWGMTKPVESVQTLLNRYYTARLEQETFQQLRHQLRQKVSNSLQKLRLKAESFQQRLQQSDAADTYRLQADLLMANLHRWQPGMTSISLEDFETGEPVSISLNPEKNGVQNAQALYKQHQKLKRARGAVEPLLQEVRSEIEYLEQVEASLHQLEGYNNPEDLQTLEEIREELIQQNYLGATQQHSRSTTDESKPYRYRTPSGFEVWIGRNNRQNDRLTFRMAGDYDLWLHSQEIAGSHVLLRLEPGAVPDEADLQFAANWAAYFSQARESDRVPVVYTKLKYVYKPKGTKPGMVVYKHETVIWGYPHKVKRYLTTDA